MWLRPEDRPYEKYLCQIVKITALVVNGNTTYAFTMIKRKGIGLGCDLFYAGVFLAAPNSDPLGSLILELTILQPGDWVNVTVDCEVEPGTAGRACGDKYWFVTHVEPVDE